MREVVQAFKPAVSGRTSRFARHQEPQALRFSSAGLPVDRSCLMPFSIRERSDFGAVLGDVCEVGFSARADLMYDLNFGLDRVDEPFPVGNRRGF